MGELKYIVGVLRPLKVRISCQYLHFAQTEDIWLKSELEGKRGVSLTKEVVNEISFSRFLEQVDSKIW
jgi:hypothetical protein